MSQGNELTEQMLQEGVAILRVLLVESDERDGQRLLDALRGGGHAVYSRQVEHLADLEAALRDEAWDIALLSSVVPELSPVDALDLLSTQQPDLPVVLAIERGSKLLPTELLETGACDFVFKSNPSRLLAVVERECTKAMLRRDEQPGSEQAARLLEGEARFLQLASNVPECYWLLDAESQQVTYVSNGYEQIWGRYVEALYSDNRDWLKFVHIDDQARIARAMGKHQLGGLDEKFRVVRPDGSLRWLHARNFPVRNEEGAIVSVGGVASDITNQLAEQRQLPYFAHFDALTALPNQLMFYDQARRLIALAHRQKLPLGVMVVDIDRFHEVNQMLGHNCGDELLRQMAARLSGSLRESDILGRLGGDVFAVLLPEVADLHQASIVARRIIDTLALPIRVEGHEVFATASIGLVFHPQDGKDVHELVSNAEIAMRHAKLQGRNCYHCYTSAMHEDVRDRLLLETDLRNAVLRDEFVLYYQPKVSCANGRITGVEALLRWNHPRRGIVPPDQFIPLLEETGLIVQVGRWVMSVACRQAMAWQQAGLDIPSVSVNLSARQLQSETLVSDVATTLADSGLQPGSLDLEITESMLMHNADQAIHILAALKAMGVTISLDDFGTGYSSLAYLKRFPIDAVKVDRSFVKDITADSDDASITRAVITMAHHLKLKVVAEGVETAEQLALLISHQCDIIQGYFFSRPLTVDNMTALLAADHRLPAALLRSGTRKPMTLFVAVDGFDEAIAMLERDGHRVCLATNYDAAMQWFAGNLADVLICGSPRPDFDAIALMHQAVQLQPLCERLLLVDEAHWHQKDIAELSSNGLVHRVLHLPVAPQVFRHTVEEALERRHISDEYSRLSHEVEIAERELVRVEGERRRLLAENNELQEHGNQGYAILQEVVSSLPWPVLGIDAEGMLALINEAAVADFPERSLALGVSLNTALPEVGEAGGRSTALIEGQAYTVWWRPVHLEGSVFGQLLLLQKEKP